MIVTGITLYKTPFDGSYRNVVDFHKIPTNLVNQIDLKDTLSRVFYDSFDSFYVRLPSPKSIKASQDLTSLVIPESYEDIRDYNYAIINSNNKYYFYFINNIVSNNDGDGQRHTPSCDLTLKWDSWNNNIDKIMECKSINTITIKHYDRFSLVGDIIKPKFYNPIAEITDPKFEEVIDGDNRYLPVYLAVELNTIPPKPTKDDANPILTYRLSASFEIGRETSESTGRVWVDDLEISVVNSDKGAYHRNIVYFIVGVYDVIDNEYKNDFIAESNSSYAYLQKDVFTPRLYEHESLVDIPNFNYWAITDDKFKEYINSAYLTFHCPYNPILNGNTFRYPCGILNVRAFNAPVLVGDYITHTISRVYEPDDPIGGIEFLWNTAYEDRVVGQYSENEVLSISPSSVFNYDTLLANKGVYKGDFDENLDPSMYTSPIRELSIVYNGGTINLSPISPVSYDFVLTKYKDSAQISFDIKSGDNKVYTPTRVFCDMPPYISLGKDALTSYEIRNGTQLEMTRQIARWNAAKSVFTGGMSSGLDVAMKAVTKASPLSVLNSTIGGSFGFLTNVASNDLDVYITDSKIKASLSDLSNTPDYYSISMGECDRLYQDRVMLYKKSIDTNSIFYSQFVNLCYYYGYKVRMMGDIFSNNRIHFDYCETENCYIPELMINSYDKETICSIFNRGVTKWHILIGEDGYVSNFTPPTTDKTITKNNLEVKFYTDPEYISWLNEEV